jgi:small neutral amino acid transporter SnatA (MarC family)
MALPQGVLGVAIAWVFPLAVPLIAGPAAVVASMSYAARFGAGDTIIASAAVTALTAALYLAAPHIASVLRRAGLDALARLSGGLLAIIAVELAISGVRSV